MSGLGTVLSGRYFGGKLEPEDCINYLREGKISPRKTYCIVVIKMTYGAGGGSAVKGTYHVSRGTGFNCQHLYQVAHKCL